MAKTRRSRDFAERIATLGFTFETYAKAVGVTKPSVKNWCGCGAAPYTAPEYIQRQLTALEECPEYLAYVKRTYLGGKDTR